MLMTEYQARELEDLLTRPSNHFQAEDEKNPKGSQRKRFIKMIFTGRKGEGKP
jgi:hypothetical protein